MKTILLSADPVLFQVLKQDAKLRDLAAEEVGFASKDGFNYDLSGFTIQAGAQYYFFGNPNYHNHSRLTLFANLVSQGVRPLTFVSDRAVVAQAAGLGMGSVLYPNVVLDEGVKTGYNVLIMPNAVVHQGARLGNNVYLGTNVIVGKNTTIAHNAYIGDSVRIADGVKIGRNVIIKDALNVKEDIPDGVIKDSYIGDYVRIFN
jgi:UDP-3-O-[3-hydroxymyristoyl] glucosamine N-acyltransferase